MASTKKWSLGGLVVFAVHAMHHFCFTHDLPHVWLHKLMYWSEDTFPEEYERWMRWRMYDPGKRSLLR